MKTCPFLCQNPDYVNQLTQDMFYKGEPGSRVPNTDTVFVIKYDFILAENVTIPADCVLEFDGGSISGDGTGKDTITGQNTGIQAGLVKIFNTDITLSGTWSCDGHIRWFGAHPEKQDNADEIKAASEETALP